MARANRHFIPGYIWHLTHRYHKREFLLKFASDRSRWRQLLFEARKLYGVSISNYTVTSNHIHLIVTDSGSPESISRTMQYVAGKTGQEYNRRKKHKGAFWQDRPVQKWVVHLSEFMLTKASSLLTLFKCVYIVVIIHILKGHYHANEYCNR